MKDLTKEIDRELRKAAYTDKQPAAISKSKRTFLDIVFQQTDLVIAHSDIFKTSSMSLASSNADIDSRNHKLSKVYIPVMSSVDLLTYLLQHQIDITKYAAVYHNAWYRKSIGISYTHFFHDASTLTFLKGNGAKIVSVLDI